MEAAGCWANSNQVIDFLPIFVNPKNVGAHVIKDLYLEKGRTAAQVALEVGLSKSEVLRRLHLQGIRREKLKDVATDHLRPALRAPFGKRVVAGKLVDCRRELNLARYIVAPLSALVAGQVDSKACCST